MSYQYDAFFSYKRNEQSDEWHATVKNKLEFWLQHELSRSNVSIFIDREDIRSGARWRQKIAGALQKSKCLICIWSPNYFRSKWCVSEWHTFRERETISPGSALIVPARFHDGQNYPLDAQQTQSANFTPYASTMPAFWRTESAVEFENTLLQTFARDIAASINGAPSYDDSFPVIEASVDALPEVPAIVRPANSIL